MPEYSSTTITPSDGVQVPGMNGSTSGNFLLSALKSYILSEKGLANGLASLDGNGKLLSSQLPDLADDVIVVASYATLPATGTAGKLYITADNNKMYRWDPDLTTPDYVELSVDLSAYATKAELAAEERARESEDSNLKSAISFNTKRIENLEQKSGSVVDVDYPDYSVYGEVPTGKAKNAIASKLRGVTVAWNQLLQNNATKLNTNGVSFTANGDGTISVTGTPSARAYSYSDNPPRIPMQAGHVIFLFVELLSGTIPTGVEFGWSAYNGETYLAGRGLTDRYQLVKMPANTTDLVALLTDITASAVASLAGGSVNFKIASRAYDLTQALGSQVADYLYSIEQATTGAGVALFKALVSAQDESHETGRLVSTVYEAVNSEGKNQIKSATSTGTTSLYQPLINAVVNRWEPSTQYVLSFVASASCKVYVPLTIAGTAQYFNVSAGYNALGFSTKDNVDDINQDTPLVILRLNSSISTGINFSEVQLEKGSTATAYSPFFTDSLLLPTSVTLRGILKVDNNNLVVDGDEYDPETGDIERRYNTKELISSNVSAVSETYTNVVYFRISKMDDYKYQYKYVQDPYLLFSNGLSSGGTGVLDSASNIGKYRTDADMNRIWIGFAVGTTLEQAQAFMNGVNYQYELASPTSDTPLDPVLDPTLATEGGGNLSTTQTNDPAIVSAMEMTYLTL